MSSGSARRNARPAAKLIDYQTRARDCKQAGLTFVWVTDGQGWNSSKGMLRQAIENIDYIFNFELLERGALAKLCDEVFR
ncbi:MAG: hypothetical protein FJY66_00245 [Calditrichaeota bacterium]|nr:hypothetical protein [Calditrichota bacterium]